MLQQRQKIIGMLFFDGQDRFHQPLSGDVTFAQPAHDLLVARYGNTFGQPDAHHDRVHGGLGLSWPGYRSTMTSPYVLPDLSYEYDALEPWCPAETLHLHHGKHHAAYVKGANDAADALQNVDPANARLLAALRRDLTFNVSGHVLHSLFWKSLAPTTSGAPAEALAATIAASFGSQDRMIDLLKAACMGVQGSGWGAVIYDSMSKTLRIAQLHDHQGEVVPNSTVLTVVDIWEHAYYLKYRNERAGWVTAVLDHLNWTHMGLRLEAASQALIPT